MNEPTNDHWDHFSQWYFISFVMGVLVGFLIGVCV